MKRLVCPPRCNFVTSTGMDQAYQSWRLRCGVAFKLSGAGNADGFPAVWLQHPTRGMRFVTLGSLCECGDRQPDHPSWPKELHPNHPKLGETGLGKRGADLRRTCGHRLRSTPTVLSLTPLRHLQEAGGAHFTTELLRNRARKLIAPRAGQGSRGTRDRLAPPGHHEMRETTTAISRKS